jgi:hypothetical protein
LPPRLVAAAYVLGGLVALPITLMIIATVVVFGPCMGFLYASAGSWLSAMVVFSLGRWMGRDLVALQEVAYDPETPGDILRFLSRAAGAQAIAEPTLQEGKRRYGNAVLTRLTPLEVRRIDISLRSREPRGASFNWAWPLLRQPSPCWRPTWVFPCGSAGGRSPASPKFWRTSTCESNFWKFPESFPPFRSDNMDSPGSSPGQALVKPGMTERGRTRYRAMHNPVFFSRSSPRAKEPGSMSKG